MEKLEKQLTSIDFIILGLLQQQTLTGYGIRKIFETTALGNYSSSPGTIYPALSRLQRFALIESKESGFQIQPRGTKALVQWLERPVSQADIQKKMAELVLRFAFMEELLSAIAQEQFLTNLLAGLKIYIHQLEQFYMAGKSNMNLTAQLAFEHGLSSYKNDLNWVKKTLKVIKK